MKKLATIGILGLALTSLASAQSLIGRESTQNYNFVYGAGGDTHSGSNGDTRTTLDTSDSFTTPFFGSTSGFIGGTVPYAGTVNCLLEQSYAITGSLASFTGISADSQTALNASSSGLGSALMTAANPGNELILNFNVESDIDFHLAGAIAFSPSEIGPGNVVALQKWDGFVWQNIFTSFTLQDQQGAFDVSGVLTAGEYRMKSALALSAITNESVLGNYEYQLDVVPEPITMFAIAPALMLIARKRRKS